jgi:glycosyltransferase involved in cell wall biosynthesis
MTSSRPRARLRVLLSAYACLPGWGTEPGVGWNTATLMARHHDVWLLTYAGFRRAIEAELAERPVPGLKVVYHRLANEHPRHVEEGQWRTGLAEQAHYYAWQVTAAAVARRLQALIRFDLAHHVTFVKYWAPSAVADLGVPFIWGPVGGGESAPRAFYSSFSAGGLRYERRRDLARSLFERDPRVRRTARNAALAFATTEESRARVSALGAKKVSVRSAIGLTSSEVDRLLRCPPAVEGPLRFLAMGRLLAFKGYRFALEAFALARREAESAGNDSMAGSELWLLGDGPERPALEALARTLELGDCVRMPGHLPRDEVFGMLCSSHALLHPSLHESGGGVCLEAMAAGRPIICFDLGGSALHVSEDAGFRVHALEPAEATAGLMRAIGAVAGNGEGRRAMGAAGRAYVRRHFVWEDRIAALAECYREVATAPSAMGGDGAVRPAILSRIDG